MLLTRCTPSCSMSMWRSEGRLCLAEHRAAIRRVEGGSGWRVGAIDSASFFLSGSGGPVVRSSVPFLRRSTVSGIADPLPIYIYQYIYIDLSIHLSI